MKRFDILQQLLLVLFSLAWPASAMAYDIKSENKDGVTIYYDVSNNNEAIVTFGDFVAGEDARYSGNVVIPSSVLRDGQTIPVVGIGIGAFSGCYGLTSVEIPNTVTNIDNYAFEFCSALDNVVLPNSINGMGASVFFACTNLKSITSLIAEPFPVSTTTFYTQTNTTLYVPAGTKTAYESTAGWKFSDIVEMEDNSSPSMSASDVTLWPNQKSEISICLQNGETQIIALQFDLTLPEGIEKCSYDDGYGGKIQHDRCPDFTGRIEAGSAGGTYTVVLYSESNQSIVGSDGAVCFILLQSKGSLSAGSYQGKLTNITLVKDDHTKIYPEDATFTIVVKDRLKGDCNGDGTVDVQDITEIAEYIVHQKSEIDLEAADMDEDGVVDVADITLVVKAIMEAKPSSSRMIENTVPASDLLSLVDMGGGQYAINLTNNGAYVASQFDINLPKGCTINLEKSSRCESHQLCFEQIGDTSYRVVIYSLDNVAYMGNEGALLSMSVEGSPEGMALGNVLFVNDMHDKIFFGSVPVTDGIRTVKMDKAADGIYTIDGRKAVSIGGLGKGIYIVNGRKVVIE